MSLNLSNQVRAQFENTKNVQKNPEGKTEKKKRREKPTSRTQLKTNKSPNKDQGSTSGIINEVQKMSSQSLFSRLSTRQS